METKLYIGDLPEDAGPGDILGAIVNETSVDDDEMGNVSIGARLQRCWFSIMWSTM